MLIFRHICIILLKQLKIRIQTRKEGQKYELQDLSADEAVYAVLLRRLCLYDNRASVQRKQPLDNVYFRRDLLSAGRRH